MKYSKKERREIYLKAAELIENGTRVFMCHALEKLSGMDDNTDNNSVLGAVFPEWYSLRPEDASMSWFAVTHENRRKRIDILKKSAEMCR